jgi:hypothetical protein
MSLVKHNSFKYTCIYVYVNLMKTSYIGFAAARLLLCHSIFIWQVISCYFFYSPCILLVHVLIDFRNAYFCIGYENRGKSTTVNIIVRETSIYNRGNKYVIPKERLNGIKLGCIEHVFGGEKWSMQATDHALNYRLYQYLQFKHNYGEI